MIERTHLFRVTSGVNEETGETYTKEELVKPLTDEEIRHLQAQCHLKNVGYDTFIMRFARAILKKASEK